MLTPYEEAVEAMTQLIEELKCLEIEWTAYDHGRFHLDGIQHTRRDGSVIVITDEGDGAGYLVGFYTAEQHDAGWSASAYAECATAADVVLAIIEEGQSR